MLSSYHFADKFTYLIGSSYHFMENILCYRVITYDIKFASYDIKFASMINVLFKRITSLTKFDIIILSLS